MVILAVIFVTLGAGLELVGVVLIASPYMNRKRFDAAAKYRITRAKAGRLMESTIDRVNRFLPASWRWNRSKHIVARPSPALIKISAFGAGRARHLIVWRDQREDISTQLREVRKKLQEVYDDLWEQRDRLREQLEARFVETAQEITDEAVGTARQDLEKRMDEDLAYPKLRGRGVWALLLGILSTRAGNLLLAFSS